MSKTLMLFLVLIIHLVIGSHQALGQCLPVVASNSDDSLCEGDALTLTASITLPGGCILGGAAPYIWAGPGAPAATAIPQITIGASAAGDYSVSVLIAQDGTLGAPACPCVGLQGASNIITVNPTPITPTIGVVDAEICEGDNLELLYTGPAIPGGTFAWIGPNGFSSTDQDPIIFNAPTANTGGYQLTIVDGNACSSPQTAPVDVVVNANPAAPVAPDVDVCPNFPAELAATATGTILWYESPVGGSPLFTGSPYTTEVLTQTTIFYVETFDVATGCTSERIAVTANLLGPIPQPVARDTIVCEGDPAILLAIGTGIAGNSLLWYDVPFGGIPLETDAMPPEAHTYTTTFGLLTTTTFYVAEFDAATGCESERSSIKVVVMPQVPEPVATDLEVCEGTSVTLTATHGVGSNGGDFYWFDAATDGVLLGIGQSLALPADLIAAVGTYNFYVEERYNGCTSPSREVVTVTVNPNPELPVTTAATICSGLTAILTATGEAGNNLNWYSDAQGSNLLFTGNSFETAVLTQNTTFWVHQESPATGCYSELVAVTATVNAVPLAPSATDITVCNDAEATIVASGSGNANTVLNLYEDLNDVTPLFSSAMPPSNLSFDLGTLAAGTYTYYIEEENTLTTCVSVRIPVTVIVQAVASPPNVLDANICEGGSATLLASSSSGTNGVFNWYSDAGLSDLLSTGSSFNTEPLTATTQYYVTEASGVCESSATLVAVTVNPNPAAPSVLTPVPVCEGATVTLNATGSGGLLNWYSDGAGTNQVGSGSSFTTAAITQSTTYWVQEVTIGTACVSELVAVTANVLVAPNAPSASSITICEGEEGSILATGSGTGSLVWYELASGGTALQTDAMPPANATYNVGILPLGTYTFYVEEDNGSCVSPRTAVTVTVTPTPVAPTVNAPVNTCEGESATLMASSATNGTFLWYDETETNLLFTGSTYVTAPLSSTTNYVVKEMVNGCESVGELVLVTVNPKPTNPVVVVANVCSGSITELSASTTGGNFLNWYDDNTGSNLLFTGTVFTTPELTQTTTFWVQAVDPTTACTSDLIPVTASVLTVPSAPSATGLTLCEGETGEISASGSGIGSLIWYDTGFAGAALQIDDMPPADASLAIGPLPAGTYTYYVEEFNGACSSSRTPITVIVNATPSPPTVQAPVATCEGTSASMTASSATNGVFNWYDATGTTLLFTGSEFVSPALTETTTYQVAETVNSCESNFTEVLVVVSPQPSVPLVSPATVCEGQSADLMATPSTLGNTLNWYADAAGTTLLFTGNVYTTPVLNQTSIFYVQELNGLTNCVSELVAVTVTVESLPTPPTAEKITICAGETGTLTASGSGTGTLNWYDVASGGTALQTNGMPPATASFEVGPFPAGTYVYYIAEENANCSSTRTAVTVTVTPAPLAPIVSSETICEDSQTTLTATSGSGAVGEFYWYSDASTTNLLYVGNNFSTGLLISTSTFYVTQLVNGCESPAEPATVFVNPLPADPLVSPAAVCEGESATLTASAGGGTIINWYADAAGSVLLGSGTSLETAALYQNTIVWVQALVPGTGCKSNLIPLTISVQQAPTAPAAVDISICAGETGELIAIGSGSGTINWYDAASSNAPIQSDAMPPNNSSLTVGPFPTTGTFVFYVEEVNGSCASERTAVAVIVKPMPSAPIVGGTNICEGESAILTATHSSPTQGAFFWYDASGTELLFTGATFTTNLLTVTTTFQVVESSNGCESVPSFVTVVVNEVPNNPIVAPQEVCEGTSAELVATNTSGNVVSWYDDDSGSNLLGSGANFSTPELTQTTTFWVQQIAPSSGCTSSLVPVTVTVLPNPSPPASTNITICENEVGTIIASGSGVGFLNWYNQSEGGFPLQSSPMPPANVNLNVGPFVPGVYVFYVAEDNGMCVSSRTPVTVTVVPTPDAPIASGTAICEGEHTILNAVSSSGTNGDFSWYDVTGNTLLYTGGAFDTGVLTETTSYLVREIRNGCESPTTLVTVVVNPSPTNPVVSPLTICEGETANIMASGTAGNFLNWYDDASGSNLIFTGAMLETPVLVQSTTFWVQELVVGTGCTSDLIAVTVTVNPQPSSPSTTNITICEGEIGEITASGTGAANTQLVWYDVSMGGVALQIDDMGPATSVSFIVGPFAAGSYTYYVEELNTVSGCRSYRTAVEVLVNPKPQEPSVDDVSICEGESATLVSPGIGIFNWYDSATEGNLLQVGLSYTTPILVSTTSYFITHEINGCESDREEVVVTVNPLPEVPLISSNAPLCEGDSLLLTAQALAGVSYVWTGPNEFESTLQNPIIPNVTEADHQGTYTLKVIDNTTGCISKLASVFVEITPIPQTPSISSNSPVCAGVNLVLTASEIFGVSEYTWTLPNDSIVKTSVPSLTIPMVNVANSGTYGVSVSINGCTSGIANTDVVVIGLGSIPVANSNSPVCEGEDIILMADAIAGAIYQWSGPDSFSSNAQNPVVESATLANAGTYELVITVSGCPTTSPGSTFVEVLPGPVIAGISSNSPVCQGENVEIEAPFIANASYLWYGPNGDSVGGFQSIVIRNTVQALHQGTYTLVVTDTLTGCSTSAEIRIFVDGGTGLVILADNSGPVCAGDDVKFSVNVTPAQPNATFEWYGPNNVLFSTEQNPLLIAAEITDAGVYTVLVDGNSGCLAGSMNSTTLEVNEALNVDAGEDVTITQGQSVQLSASGADVYSWSPGIYLDNASVPNPIATPPVGIHTYEVTGLSIEGCMASDTLIITVEPETDVLGIYDLFTPNGDGVNDTFVIEYIENIQPYTLSIYNRGGIELLNTSNYQNDWDGTYRGRDLPEGTYWYVIRSREQGEFKGAVTLIR